MLLQTGLILKSTAALEDTVFAGTIIFIAEYNSGGALGFIINQPFNRSLNELVEFSHIPYFPLYSGGPVDTEHLFFIHRRPDVIEDGSLVKNGIYYGGDFTQAVTAISAKTLSSDDLKIFVGYCGWNAGELEAEIAEGSWEVVSEAVDVFV